MRKAAKSAADLSLAQVFEFEHGRMRLRSGADADVLLEAQQIAVGILAEELAYAGFEVAGAIPLFFHGQEKMGRVAQVFIDGIEIVDAHFQIDSASERRDEFAGDPVALFADLVEHEMDAAFDEIGKALLHTGVADLETAEVKIEGEAGVKIAH